MDNERRQRPFARRNDAGPPGADVLGSELRALPELEAPDHLWRRVREHVDADVDNTPSARQWHRQLPLAAAACVALVALAAVLVTTTPTTDPGVPANGPVTAGNEAIPERPVVVPEVQTGTAPFDHAAIIEALLEQSRLAEQRRRAVLAFYSPAAPERLLRAHIGGIDAALNEQMFAGKIEPRSREALLRDRVGLMADLTDIERYRQHEFVRQVSF